MGYRSGAFHEIDPGPYPGFRFTGTMLKETAKDGSGEAWAMLIGLAPFWVPDIPLSFCLDTLCLPYDITRIGYVTDRDPDDLCSYHILTYNRQGRLDGYCEYQYQTTIGMMSHWLNYRDGIPHGRTGASTGYGYGVALTRTNGVYRNGRGWEGTIVTIDTNANYRINLATYSKGVLVTNVPLDISVIPYAEFKKRLPPSSKPVTQSAK